MMSSAKQNKVTGVIPAAGRGTRAYPHTRVIPKGMLDMCGKPLLYYTVEIMRDKLGITDIVIVLNEKGNIIKKYFGDGSQLGVKISYVFNDKVHLGPLYSVYLTRKVVKTEHFVVMLSDELYLDSNHDLLAQHNFQDNKVTISVRDNSRWKDICKNFSIQFNGEKVSSLIEKPKHLDNNLLGCGTYIFHRDIYGMIEDSFDNKLENILDLTSFINRVILLGNSVGFFQLTGMYINVNYQHDVNYARTFIRKKRLPNAKISVVLSCDTSGNEKAVCDILDEIPVEYEVVLVAQNQSRLITKISRTRNLLCVTSAGNHGQSNQASLIDSAIRKSNGEIIIFMMGDGTFEVSDIEKILAYISEAELVLGTRTTRQLIEQGANMSLPAHIGNYFLAKLIEALWVTHKTRITDVGCIFRAIWRDEYFSIAKDLNSTGGAFWAEMIIECIRRRLQVVEIPVSYCKKIEEKKITFSERTPKIFFTILSMIFSKRLFGGSCLNLK